MRLHTTLDVVCPEDRAGFELVVDTKETGRRQLKLDGMLEIYCGLPADLARLVQGYIPETACVRVLRPNRKQAQEWEMFDLHWEFQLEPREAGTIALVRKQGVDCLWSYCCVGLWVWLSLVLWLVCDTQTPPLDPVTTGAIWFLFSTAWLVGWMVLILPDVLLRMTFQKQPDAVHVTTKLYTCRFLWCSIGRFWERTHSYASSSVDLSLAPRRRRGCYLGDRRGTMHLVLNTDRRLWILATEYVRVETVRCWDGKAIRLLDGEAVSPGLSLAHSYLQALTSGQAWHSTAGDHVLFKSGRDVAVVLS